MFGMNVYSLELTIDGADKAAKVFRALKTFDPTVIMGSTLQLLREQKPIEVQLDRSDRAKILRRLIDLLDELERLGANYKLSANNVPRTSHLWKASDWTRADVATELTDSEILAADRERAAEIMKNYVPPEPPPSRKLLDQRWRDIVFTNLLPSEQGFIIIWALRAEVNNGGFATYFYNSAGDTALEALEALARIGSSDVYSILSDALQLLQAACGYSAVRENRRKISDQLIDDAFTEVNTRFSNTSEDVVGMAFRAVETDYEMKGMI
jgi:hypothetical protein